MIKDHSSFPKVFLSSPCLSFLFAHGIMLDGWRFRVTVDGKLDPFRIRLIYRIHTSPPLSSLSKSLPTFPLLFLSSRLHRHLQCRKKNARASLFKKIKNLQVSSLAEHFRWAFVTVKATLQINLTFTPVSVWADDPFLFIPQVCNRYFRKSPWVSSHGKDLGA